MFNQKEYMKAGGMEISTKCLHAYLHSVSEFLLKCEACGEFIPKHKTTAVQSYGEIEMPPRIYEFDKIIWEKKRPWPRISFVLAKKYGWYISFLHDYEYLIMSVTRGGKIVFYSARSLESESKLKYLYPSVPKVYWTSVEPEKFKKTVVFLEGVADAAYISSILSISAVALLGSWYDGSLNQYLQDKKIRIMMDGDAKGIEAAFRVMQSFKKDGLVKVNVIMLPEGANPTNLNLIELKRLIKNLKNNHPGYVFDSLIKNIII